MSDDVGQKGPWAPMGLVERYHLEDNMWKAAHGGRLAKAEWKQEQSDDRFRQGADTFQKITESIELLNEKIAPKPTSMLKILGLIAMFLGAVGTPTIALIWQAARYPDRLEFDATRREFAAAQKDVEIKIGTLATQQAVMTQQVSVVQASVNAAVTEQSSIKGKLDVLIRQGRAR